MPKLKVLSGAEVVRILSIFGFKVAIAARQPYQAATD